MKERFINPFTDYGFKRLFGSEPNKELLVDFLNELLRDEESSIVELTYLKNEQLGNTTLDRGAVFDVYCVNEKGERFIVELQKAKQDFFKDRSVFYSTFPIQAQAERGDWSFELKAVYTVGILDFVFGEDEGEPDKFLYKVKLTDQQNSKVFFDKLTYIYLEMPKFKKSEAELESHFDKWLYVIRKLHLLEERPIKLQERIFSKLFDAAALANLSRDELSMYDASLKHYWDVKNVIDTARAEGRAEGHAEGRAEGELLAKLKIASELRRAKMEVEDILKITGLSLEQLELESD